MDGFFPSEDGMEDGRRGRKNGGQRMAVVADAAVTSMHLSTIHKERADFRAWSLSALLHFFRTRNLFLLQAIQQYFSDIEMAEWLLKCLNNRFSQ